MLAGVLFVIPRYSLPDPGTTLIWGLPSGPTLHVLIMGVVAFTWGRVAQDMRAWDVLLWGLLLAVCAEALQLLPFVDRGVNWEDVGANVLGVGVGWLLAMGSRKRRRSASPSASPASGRATKGPSSRRRSAERA